MRSMFYWLSLSSFLLTCSISSNAEEPTGKALTLAEAKEVAQQRNFEIIASNEELAAANGQLVAAKTWENPELSVGPGMKRIPGSGGESEDSFFRGAAELNQLILFPGKRALQVAIAEHDSSAAEEARNALKNQIGFKVIKAFYVFLEATELAQLRTSQVQSAKLFFESSNKRVVSGYGSDIDSVRGEAELINSQKLLSAAEIQIIAARASLNVLLGRTPSAPLALEGNLQDFRPKIIPAGFESSAIESNPSFKVQLLHAKKAGLSVDAAKLSKAPDFQVGPFVEYGKDEQVYGLGITLPLNLWDNKEGAIASAAAEQRKELAELEKLRLEISEAVLTSISNFRAIQRERALYSTSFLMRLRDSMNRAEKSYETSGTSVLLYLEAKRTYFEAQASYYETLAKFPASYAELQSALGVPLD